MIDDHAITLKGQPV